MRFQSFKENHNQLWVEHKVLKSIASATSKQHQISAYNHNLTRVQNWLAWPNSLPKCNNANHNMYVFHLFHDAKNVFRQSRPWMITKIRSVFHLLHNLYYRKMTFETKTQFYEVDSWFNKLTLKFVEANWV